MRFFKKSQVKKSLSKKLRYVILAMCIPLVLCIVLAFVTLAFYAARYAQITHNVNVSSKFSLDFKENMDLKMYHYTVQSKEQESLPVSDVEDAIHLAKALKKTTYRKESQRAIRNVLDYCENLENKMYMLAATKDYDSRQIQLDNNIYVLTDLIQGKMMNYIYYEAGYMASLEQKMLGDIKLVIMIAVLFVSSTVILLLYRSFHFAKGITEPISKLCNNVNLVGNGVFDIPYVYTNELELAQLNDGILHMANRISHLLENVKEEEMLNHMTALQLLQAQVNPHFLYNTMDTIVWLVEADKQQEAIQMLTNLSLFFRTALSKGQDIISLGEEILHTQSYLDIQQVRYRDILEYDISIPDDLKQIRVPKLTLQPLAENALYHGVKEKRGKSKITITCKEEEDKIILMVGDNGIGIRPEQLQNLRDSLEQGERIGFGLAAVHERLRLYFGENYGVEITSTFEVGTTVEVHIPKNFQPQS